VQEYASAAGGAQCGRIVCLHLRHGLILGDACADTAGLGAVPRPRFRPPIVAAAPTGPWIYRVSVPGRRSCRPPSPARRRWPARSSQPASRLVVVLRQRRRNPANAASVGASRLPRSLSQPSGTVAAQPGTATATYRTATYTWLRAQPPGCFVVAVTVQGGKIGRVQFTRIRRTH